MLKSLGNIFRVKELRRKVIITLALLIVYRAGSHIPLPGIDIGALGGYFKEIASRQVQNLISLAGIFTGGNFRRMTIFALGVMPYISASLIMQVLSGNIPSLEKLAKEGKAGYEKINQYSRILTLFICLIPGLFIAIWLESIGRRGGTSVGVVVPYPGLGFKFVTMVTVMCGTMFLMWLGEQIQERGVGNGVSLIITAGILARLPRVIMELKDYLSPFDSIKLVSLALLLAIAFAIFVTVVLFAQAQRRIPIQYARRVVGRRMYGGGSSFLPIKVDMAGIIAIILASTLFSAVSLVVNFISSRVNVPYFIQGLFDYGTVGYMVIYVILIIFFMYFYTAMIFNPIELANNLKKNGGFIPGIRAGKNTVDYIDYVVTRIVFIGALYVSFIAIFPSILSRIFHVGPNTASFLGGTSVMIMVGVLLDTMRQIEGQLLVQHYDGFMRKGKLRGRR